MASVHSKKYINSDIRKYSCELCVSDASKTLVHNLESLANYARAGGSMFERRLYGVWSVECRLRGVERASVLPFSGDRAFIQGSRCYGLYAVLRRCSAGWNIRTFPCKLMILTSNPTQSDKILWEITQTIIVNNAKRLLV